MAKKPYLPHDKPPPQCKAILLCEGITIEAGTGKLSLIGLIRNLDALTVPGHTEPMRAFLQLVEGIGRYDITIEIRDLADDKIIGRGSGPSVFFPDPLVVRQLLLPIAALPIVHAGNYDVIVFANDQEVDRQQFTVGVADDIGGSNL